MTVGELIEKLKTFPVNYEVWLLHESETPVEKVETCSWASDHVSIS